MFAILLLVTFAFLLLNNSILYIFPLRKISRLLKNPRPIRQIIICLTSLTRAKLNDKMAFPT